MRLADRHGLPLSRVMSEYPAWELPYWAVWMSREPSDGRRIEWAVASLHSTFVSVNSKKGASVPKAQELVIPDYWFERHEKARLVKSKADASALIQAFAKAGCEIRQQKDESEYLNEH